MFPDQGRRPFAIITGASRGIGAAYARALAGQGYDLFLVSRDKARMDQLASELQTNRLVSVDVEVLDLAEPDAAHRLYAAARVRREQVDLLVNNAGFALFGPLLDLPMHRIQSMLRLHVDTVVESIRLFLPGMVERRAGAIITVASIAGFFAVPYLAEYAATKGFLIAFSEALAEEVRSVGVRVQVCCPGTTETDFHETAGFRTRSPLGIQTASEVVAVSLAALKRNRVIVTIGWKGYLLTLLSRWVPRSILVRGTAEWMRRSVVVTNTNEVRRP